MPGSLGQEVRRILREELIRDSRGINLPKATLTERGWRGFEPRHSGSVVCALTCSRRNQTGCEGQGKSLWVLGVGGGVEFYTLKGFESPLSEGGLGVEGREKGGEDSFSGT